MQAHQPMVNAQGLLYAAMREEKLKVYELPDGRVVEVVATEKVKVRKAREDSDE